MAVQLEDALLARSSLGSGRSSFERTVLPEFARWFLGQVEIHQPDLFVPVETKGARLLEAVLAYARTHLGASLRVPVVYTPALAFFDPDELAQRRPLLLDDAARTGTTIERHRARVSSYGVEDVSVAVCIAHEGANLSDVAAFRTVDEGLYREYLWQLAELVVARGLPPEVDHHIFRLSMRGALADRCADLRRLMQPLGRLSFDGPVTTSADVVSMTLHSPAFPDAPTYPCDGLVRDEGARKLRLFADKAHDTIYVVPVAFPALDLPASVDPDRLDLDFCRDVLERWTSGRSTVGDLLLNEAHTRNADLLFRTISTATEVDLVQSFARFLGREMADSTVALSCERGSFGQLYGARVGDLVADRIDADIATPFLDEASADAGGSAQTEVQLAREPMLSVDPEVAMGTESIARYLKNVAVTASLEPGSSPMRRVGLSLDELAHRLPPDGIDRLLLSRCIDYGLARTTLVPFTDVVQREDGSVEIRRRYRVSETMHSQWQYEDIGTFRQEQDEELIALTATMLARRTGIWSESPVPYTAVANVIAILNACVLDAQYASIRIVHSTAGPELVLGDPGNERALNRVASRHFRLEGDGIRPTDEFLQRYEEETLRLDVRGATTGSIENYIKEIAAAINASDDATGLLLRWATAAAPRKGLDVVEHHLRRAAEEVTGPVKRLLGGADVPQVDAAAAVSAAQLRIDAAREAIGRLELSARTELDMLWMSADRTQRRLIETATTPNDPDRLMALAQQNCELATGIVDAVDAFFRGDRDGDGAKALADAMVDLERRATVVGDDGEAPHLEDEVERRRAQAAEGVLRVVKLVRARAAAVAWTYSVLPSSLHVVEEQSRPAILVADLAGSTVRSTSQPHVDYAPWVTDALNLVGQWARAFRGREIGQREGDDIRLAFPTVDHALLCAAVVQVHADALQRTGVETVSWAFRMAVDAGEMTTIDNNEVGSCLSVPSKLVKFDKEDPAASGRILLAPRATQWCGTALRALLRQMEDEFSVGPDRERAIRDGGVRFRPHVLMADAAVDLLLDRASLPAEVASASAPAEATAGRAAHAEPEA